MQWIQVVLPTLPKLLFAHTYQTENSTWELVLLPSCVEITVILQGNLTLTRKNGPEYNLEEGSVMCTLHDAPYHVSVHGRHRHATFSLQGVEAVFCVSPKETLKSKLCQDMPEKLTVFLPETIPPGAASLEVSKLLCRLIEVHENRTVVSLLTEEKLILEILSVLHDIAITERQQGGQAAHYANPYSVRAVQYINRHIRERINAEEIARTLGISYGHFSRVFKEDMGSSVMDYINTQKMNLVKDAIISRDVSLEEAGALIGIDDANYLSRIFKKHVGVTITEYKRLLPAQMVVK